MKKLFGQISKFTFVGVTAFIIDFGFLYIFTEWLGVHYLLSNVLAFVIATIYNYVLSIRWVFDTDTQHSKVTVFVVFWVLTLIGLGLNSCIMWLMVDLCGLYYMLAKVVATLVVMVYNFITRKKFLEQDKGESAADGPPPKTP